MKKTLLTISILSTILSSFLPIKVFADSSEDIINSPLVINEFMPNPIGSDSDFEWIELYNSSNETIQLEDWELDGKTIEAFELSPSGFVVIANNKENLLQRYPDLENVLKLSISLKNSADEIILTNGTFTDIIRYDNSIEGVSWERINFCSDNIELSPENNSIGQINDNYEAGYCEDTVSLQIEASLDNVSFSNNYTGFANENLYLQIVTEISYTYENTRWYFDDTLSGTGTVIAINSTEIGTHDLKIQSSVNSEQIEQVFQIQLFPRIKFNEIMPNPEGSDEGNEWIEFYSEKPSINLDEWILKDKSSQETVNISGDNYLVHYNSITLNNSNEEVYLYTPTGLLSDSLSYEATQENQSLSRTIDGAGIWTDLYELTPGESNKPKKESNITENLLTISETKLMPLDLEVCIQGYVTANPDSLSESYFYIQDETSGIRVTYKETPIITLGDKVRVCGKLDISREEYEIDSTNVELLGENSLPVPTEVNRELSNYAGRLIILKGNISKTSSSTFYIETASGELKISILDSTGIEGLSKSKGDYAEVIGIVSIWGLLDNGQPNYRILPRSIEDIKITHINNNTKSTKSSSSVLAKNSKAYSLELKAPALHIENSPIKNGDLPRNHNGDNNYLTASFPIFFLSIALFGFTGINKEYKQLKIR